MPLAQVNSFRHPLVSTAEKGSAHHIALSLVLSSDSETSLEAGSSPLQKTGGCSGNRVNKQGDELFYKNAPRFSDKGFELGYAERISRRESTLRQRSTKTRTIWCTDGQQ